MNNIFVSLVVGIREAISWKVHVPFLLMAALPQGIGTLSY